MNIDITTIGPLLGAVGGLAGLTYAGFARVKQVVEAQVEAQVGERIADLQRAIELADRPRHLRRHRSVLVITTSEESPRGVEQRLRAAGWRQVETEELRPDFGGLQTPEVDRDLALAAAKASMADLLVLDQLDDAAVRRLSSFMGSPDVVWYAPFPMRVNVGLLAQRGGDVVPANSLGQLVHWTEAVLARQRWEE